MSIDKMTKRDLLKLLESVPQRFWPPRPTRQDKATLLRAVSKAMAETKVAA